MQVKIYRPAKNAMQSGRGKSAKWVLEYELETTRRPDPLMGWATSADTNNQVKLYFDDVTQAQEYATRKGWQFVVLPEQARVLKPRNYVDNFKYKPVQPKPATLSASETEKAARPAGTTAKTAEAEKKNTAAKAAPTGEKIADAAIPGEKKAAPAKKPAAKKPATKKKAE